MKITLNACRKIYRLAEARGHMFDARTYIEFRAEGWAVNGALFYARRAYRGRQCHPRN